MWLKEMESGEYFSEVYIAHSIVDHDATVAILTFTRIMIIRSDGLKLDYAIHLDTIEDVSIGVDGICIKLKKPMTRVLSIEETTSREWFADIINRTMEQRKEERERQ
jgi:vacuolar protein sorting-associated protein 13A/C